MSRRRKKKRGLIPVIFLGLFLGVCLVVAIGFASGSLAGTGEHAVTQKLSETVRHAVTKKVSETVMEQAVKQALESAGDPQGMAWTASLCRRCRSICRKMYLNRIRQTWRSCIGNTVKPIE